MASLLLGDLNDYIEPSQACILPVNKTDETRKDEPVSINLTDCLACSGCITSAETVLVVQQTYNKLLEAVDSNSYKEIVVSISSQTVTALAVKYRISVESTWKKLNWFFKQRLGVNKILDVSLARCITLACLAKEFLNSYEHERSLIVSACPGWVCYAEKRYTEFLPLLSITRSPQQMAGVLAKHYGANFSTSEIYHCTVMPCFDKKLEASREDFIADVVNGTKDVDTVITTTEMMQIFEERLPGMRFEDFLEDENCEPISRHSGSSSGGYLDFVLNYAKVKLFPTAEIKIVPGRNSDVTEYHLIVDARVVLKFAAIYGFRNIQTFVIKNKKQSSNTFDFVEIMACPSGCLNGGGQPKSEDSSRRGQKEHIENMEKSYQSLPLTEQNPPFVRRLLDWVEQDKESRSELLEASYKAVSESEGLKKVINVQW